MELQFIQLVKARKWGRERTFQVYSEGEHWTACDLKEDVSGEGSTLEQAVENCWTRIAPNLFD